MNRLARGLAVIIAIAIATLGGAADALSSRKHYSNQGGHDAGGKGSSHKGGHDVNPRTNNRYTRH